MDNYWARVLEFAEVTTHRVGEGLLKYFGNVRATKKADGSLVTEADKWADSELRAAIAGTFPDHGVLTEESQHLVPNEDWFWAIDPLDGTTNFTRGIPIWGIALGLLYKGTPVFGYVHFPPLNQSFHGFWDVSGELDLVPGAFLNHQPIHSSADEPSQNHFFSLCARSTQILKPGFPCKIRMLGVASYNFLAVASGTAIGGVEATPKIWDLAGVWPILQAAGGKWVNLGSEPLFPLKAGEDYGKRSLPTLVVSRADLVHVFAPWVESLRSK
jgi:myo-inositol-1(or 4)-monophosphatase